jgi:hypothetical protein
MDDRRKQDIKGSRVTLNNTVLCSKTRYRRFREGRIFFTLSYSHAVIKVLHSMLILSHRPDLFKFLYPDCTFLFFTEYRYIFSNVIKIIIIIT